MNLCFGQRSPRIVCTDDGSCDFISLSHQVMQHASSERSKRKAWFPKITKLCRPKALKITYTCSVCVDLKSNPRSVRFRTLALADKSIFRRFNIEEHVDDLIRRAMAHDD